MSWPRTERLLPELLSSAGVEVLLCAGLVVVSLACVHHLVAAPEPEARMAPVSFLEDGRTTEDQIREKLGIPSAKFERGAIWTYRLAEKEGQELRVVLAGPSPAMPEIDSWKDAGYSLVLVFDDQQVLKRHSLVKVR